MWKTLTVYFHCLIIVLGREWGLKCHPDCQCKVTTLAQTVMSRWLPGNEQVRGAFCMIQRETDLDSMLRGLPWDTQALTLLQASDSPHRTLTSNMTSHLTLVKGIDFQGSRESSLALSPTALLPSSAQLQFASLQNLDINSSDFPVSNLSSLQCLQVMRCHVPTLMWPFFEGLESLHELYMVQNGIEVLDEDLFYDTPNLRRISLAHNHITLLQYRMFMGLDALEMLDLSNNNLNQVSLLSFPCLASLRWLELKHNPIRVLLPEAFLGLNATERLSLGHDTQALHLTRFCFLGLQSLLFLNIPNVDNDILRRGHFTGLTSLNHLRLRGRIVALDEDTFEGGHNCLQKLILRECNLQTLKANSLRLLSNLTSLDLSHNLICQLPEAIFRPLESLRELLLNNNRLTILPELIFDNLPFLKTLRLEENNWSCSCQMSWWNEAAISQGRCQKEENPCTRFVRDPRVVPRCHTPTQFKGMDVFQVIPQLACTND